MRYVADNIAFTKKYVEENLASMILNKNTSVDVVANDLTFPAKSGDLALSWSTSDESIISETGKVTFDGQEQEQFYSIQNNELELEP